MENTIIKNAFNAYTILLEMLEDRNYIIEDNNRKNINLFARDFEDNINLVFKKEGDELYCNILKQDKITKKDLIKIIETIIEKTKIKHILIMCNDKQLLNYISDFRIKFKINLEIFLISNMQINKSKHEFVPQHILFTDKEKKTFLKEKGYIEEQLPKIKSTDPMCLYYNGNEGDIFKIIRNSMTDRNKTSGQGIYYRIVVE
jgi:DNA-directed RNA polymerase subunit H (RpoH/RPB5)